MKGDLVGFGIGSGVLESGNSVVKVREYSRFSSEAQEGRRNREVVGSGEVLRGSEVGI